MSEEEKRPSLKDALGKAFDKIAAKAEEEKVEVQAVEDEVQAEEVVVAEDTVIPPLEAESAEESEEEITEVETEETSSEDEVPDALEPLEHWHREHKDMFTNIPREAQEFLIERDKEFQSSVTKKQMEVADIRKALEPVRAELDKFGVSDADAIRRLIGAHIRLKEDPVNTVQELMASYGVDIKDFVGEDDGTTDRSDSAAMREVKALKAELEKERATRQAETASEWAGKLEKFKAGHEFFDEVQEEMSRIAWSYRNEGQQPPSLDELYEKACRLSDPVWEKLQKKKSKKQLEKDKEEAAKARKASKAKVSSTPKTASEVQTGKKTLRDALSETYDRAQQAR